MGKLFHLIRLNLPVLMIGNGKNRYQMVSVFDCASAAVRSANKGVVDGEFNLGSADPPNVHDLLSGVIRQAGSRSILIPTVAAPAKAILRFLDRIDLPVLVPEQFEIADHDYVVDIEPTMRLLDWMPKYGDQEMMNAAYREFLAARRH